MTSIFEIEMFFRYKETKTIVIQNIILPHLLIFQIGIDLVDPLFWNLVPLSYFGECAHYRSDHIGCSFGIRFFQIVFFGNFKHVRFRSG